MPRFRKILVYAYSGLADDPSIRKVARLAKGRHAEVMLVDVLREDGPLLAGDLDAPVRGTFVDARMMALQRVAQDLRADGVQVTVRVLVGKPSIELSRLALDEKCELVLKTAREEDIARRLFYGTTAVELMRLCPCPVWLLRRDAPDHHHRVLAAVDAVTDRRARLGLNRRIIETARAVAQADGAELHLVHAWDAPAERLLGLEGFGGSAEVADRYATAAREVAEQRLEQLVAMAAPDLPRTHVHLRKGEPHEVIVDLGTELGTDLVVMGTEARRGIAGLVVGNTAEKVLRLGGPSILALKPDGFEPVVAGRRRKVAKTASSPYQLDTWEPPRPKLLPSTFRRGPLPSR